MRPALLSALLFGPPAWSCTLERVVLEAELPGDVAYVAVVELDEQGQVLRGSPLQPVTVDRPFGVAASREAETLLLGYSEAQLRVFEPAPRLDLLQRSPLRTPEGCEPRLPTPRWAARWVDGNRLIASEAPAPPLTAEFASGICPETSELRVTVDRRCGSTRCSVTSRSTSACTLQVDLEACGLGPAEVTLDAVGNACGQWSEAPPKCAEAPGVEPSFARLVCSDASPCEYDFYVDAGGLGDRFELETVRLFEARPFVHSALRQNVLPIPRALIRGTGYVFDMLVRDGHILLTIANEKGSWQECAGEWGVSVSRYDADTLALVQTATAARCLMRMARDPMGTGFIGVLTVAGRWHLGRFSLDGRLIASVAADDRAQPEPGEPVPLLFEDFHPAELVLVDDDRYVAALYAGRRETDPTPPRSIVVVHDAVTLQVVARHDLPAGEDPRSMVGQGSRLVLLSPQSRAILWLDALTGERVDELAVGRESFALQSFSSISAHRDGALLLAGLTGVERALLAIESPAGAERLINFDRDLDPFAVAEVPGQPSVFLAGGTSQTADGEWVGVLGLAEPDRGRFLPGSVVAGAGIVSHIVPDDAGRLLALLPWVPALVRLTPRAVSP